MSASTGGWSLLVKDGQCRYIRERFFDPVAVAPPAHDQPGGNRMNGERECGLDAGAAPAGRRSWYARTFALLRVTISRAQQQVDVDGSLPLDPGAAAGQAACESKQGFLCREDRTVEILTVPCHGRHDRCRLLLGTPPRPRRPSVPPRVSVRSQMATVLPSTRYVAKGISQYYQPISAHWVIRAPHASRLRRSVR